MAWARTAAVQKHAPCLPSQVARRRACNFGWPANSAGCGIPPTRLHITANQLSQQHHSLPRYRDSTTRLGFPAKGRKHEPNRYAYKTRHVCLISGKPCRMNATRHPRCVLPEAFGVISVSSSWGCEPTRPHPHLPAHSAGARSTKEPRPAQQQITARLPHTRITSHHAARKNSHTCLCQRCPRQPLDVTTGVSVIAGPSKQRPHPTAAAVGAAS